MGILRVCSGYLACSKGQASFVLLSEWSHADPSALTRRLQTHFAPVISLANYCHQIADAHQVIGRCRQGEHPVY